MNIWIYNILHSEYFLTPICLIICTYIISGCTLLKKYAKMYQIAANIKKELKEHQRHCLVVVRYPCDFCDFFATTVKRFKNHIQRKHTEKQFPCLQCRYAASTEMNLKKHTERKHLVKYPCNVCDYVAASLVNLKGHIERRHAGFNYLCDKCEFSTSTARI